MKRSITQWIPVVLLGAGVLLVSGVREQYDVMPVKPMAAIPTTLLGMNGQDLAIDSAERAVAGMSDYVRRSYRRDSTELFSTYVGYYNRQVQGKTIHSPKNCLPGAGWEILSASRIALPGSTTGGTTNRVLLRNHGAMALVYYWYQGRGREESSEYVVKWDLLKDAALYGRTEEALVRVVVPVRASTTAETERGVAEADSIATSVARELRVEAAKVIPSWNARG